MRLGSLATLALVFGCASPLTEARASFDEARYPEAAAEYRALAASVRGMPPDELFEYSLYRGLTHLALGDAVPAERWLLVAKRLSDSSPSLASDEQRGRLLSAWRSMGHMPGD
jgi:hypothetical protein